MGILKSNKSQSSLLRAFLVVTNSAKDVAIHDAKMKDYRYFSAERKTSNYNDNDQGNGGNEDSGGHGNSIAFGVVAAALTGLGFSYHISTVQGEERKALTYEKEDEKIVLENYDRN